MGNERQKKFPTPFEFSWYDFKKIITKMSPRNTKLNQNYDVLQSVFFFAETFRSFLLRHFGH